MRKPNILLIMTDQQSANMMSCAGNTYVNTPNMDRIAREGIRFEKTYCTNPVCLPARFSLLTGLYPLDAAVRSNDFWGESPGLPDAVTQNGLGKLLKEQGYNAVYGGKEHLPFLNSAALGFDCLCRDERDELAEKFADYIRNYREDKPFAMVASFINPHDICYMAIRDAENEDVEGNFPSEFLKLAVKELEALDEALIIPEGMSEEEFFSTVCPPLPMNYQPAADEPEAISILQEERGFKKLAREHYSDERWRLHRWAYKKLTEKVDGQIGKLLDALKESGMWDDTVIIFTSDHGDMDAAHKMEHKECLYEEACRVPLIIKGIDAPEGEVEPGLVCNGLDIYPTILDYAGAQLPDYLEGYSLKGRVQGNGPIVKRETLVVECENGIMAVDDSGKLVRYDKGARAEQFYDLTGNPGEMYDQSGDERFAKRIGILRNAIDRHLEQRPQRFNIRHVTPEDLRYTTRMALSDFIEDEQVIAILNERCPELLESLSKSKGIKIPIQFALQFLHIPENQQKLVLSILDELKG